LFNVLNMFYIIHQMLLIFYVSKKLFISNISTEFDSMYINRKLSYIRNIVCVKEVNIEINKWYNYSNVKIPNFHMWLVKFH